MPLDFCLHFSNQGNIFSTISQDAGGGEKKKKKEN